MSDLSQVQPRQVAPLPIGSGGSSSTKQQLNTNNNALTMMMAQATVDSKFDGPVPQHVTSPTIIQKFCTGSELSVEGALVVIGGLFIVYGLIAK